MTTLEMTLHWKSATGYLAIGIWLLSLAQTNGLVGAQEPRFAREQIAFYESRIRPVLIKHCYDCHSESSGTAEGELLLDSRKAMLAGGTRGPAIAPGQPQASWLLKALKHTDAELKMPPKQKRLSESIVADFSKWIKAGAAAPSADKPGQVVRQADRSFWAYQTVKDPATPEINDEQWPKRNLDRFLLAKLEAKGLAPSADAPPQILLRRLHFDLTGLPPTPSRAKRFLQRIEDKGLDAAITVEIDELLASQSFGERWGRHWLDVARFGESSGGEANISFPYAWRYRDYVIDAVNQDIPYDRFLREQIAGDLLPYRDEQERARLLIATGYLALGPKNLGEANPKQFRADVIDEQINALSRGILGSSIACARCHNHKFDPFSMQDYYALAGIFASTKTFFGTAVSPANRVAGDPLPLPRQANQKVFHRSIGPKRVAKLKAELAAMKKEEKEKRAQVFQAVRQGKDPSGIFTLRDALRIFWRSGAIEGQLEKVDEKGQALPLAMGVLDADDIGDAPLLERGDVKRPGKTIPRRFPEVMQAKATPPITSAASGRLQLAEWITEPAHPLTARVFVNRVWRHLYGKGLVRTVDDFGSTGEVPSHPQLLGHLATRFVQEGWSLKSLIREIASSRSYRQSSTFDREAFLADPENRLLWRMAKRRVDAEAIRDAMLVVSGELDYERPQASLVGRVIGDRPISLIGLDKRVPPDLDGSTNRSIYLPVIRDRLPDALELFDFAEPSLVTGHRETTNVPVQALYLMNSPFVQQRAESFAGKLSAIQGTNQDRVKQAFQWCFNRQPDKEELARSLEFLEPNAGAKKPNAVTKKRHKESSGDAAADETRQPTKNNKSGDDTAKNNKSKNNKSKNNKSKNSNAASEALISFCQALLCTAEFRNLD